MGNGAVHRKMSGWTSQSGGLTQTASDIKRWDIRTRCAQARHTIRHQNAPLSIPPCHRPVAVGEFEILAPRSLQVPTLGQAVALDA